MDLVFVSIVFGNYQKYIPYYIYSIKMTHPSAGIKIFIESDLDDKISQILEKLKRNGFQFEIIKLSNHFKEFEELNMIGAGGKSIIRWILDYENFKNYKYAYLGDIDMLYMPEKTSVLEFHLKQMESLNVPFSNKVRLFKDNSLTKRLTGLHFIKVEEYYNKIQPIIDRIKNDKKFRDNYLANLERNEHFLYKLNMETFNFDPLLLSNALQPFHGLHLGISRYNYGVSKATIVDNSSLDLINTKIFLRKYLNDPIFKDIMENVFVIELEVILRKLLLPIPLTWKIQSFKFRVKRFKKIKRKLIKQILKRNFKKSFKN